MEVRRRKCLQSPHWEFHIYVESWQCVGFVAARSDSHRYTVLPSADPSSPRGAVPKNSRSQKTFGCKLYRILDFVGAWGFLKKEVLKDPGAKQDYAQAMKWGSMFGMLYHTSGGA